MSMLDLDEIVWETAYTVEDILYYLAEEFKISERDAHFILDEETVENIRESMAQVMGIGDDWTLHMDWENCLSEEASAKLESLYEDTAG